MPRWTQLEAEAHQARHGFRGVAQEVEAPRKAKPSRESELHRLIGQDIKRRGWLCCHGSMHTATKRTPGEPDFHVLAPKGRHFMVECKTKTGKLSGDQTWFSNKAAELGHAVYIVRSFEEWCELAGYFTKDSDL